MRINYRDWKTLGSEYIMKSGNNCSQDINNIPKCISFLPANIWLSNLTSNCDWIKDVIFYTTFRMIFTSILPSFVSLFLFNWHSFCGFVSLTLKWMVLSREAVKWKIISRFYLFIEWKCKFFHRYFLQASFIMKWKPHINDKKYLTFFSSSFLVFVTTFTVCFFDFSGDLRIMFVIHSIPLDILNLFIAIIAV